MNAALGRSGVLLALLGAVVGAVVIAVGLLRGRESLLRHARVYSALILGGALLATVAMEHALVTHDFHLAYVAQNNSRETPLLYDVTGMWSALSGSILLWGLVLAGYVVAMVVRFRRRATDSLVAWATLVTYVVSAFFFGLMTGPANPFTLVSGAVPADGAGPNPLLQDRVLVAFHPPLLYLGFVGFTIPFAFALASLITGRLGEGWLVETRRWTLCAWGFLSVGVVLGAWWSYQVLGWGGFWAWDPVENAAFLPWLCATAYLHSVMVQERRGLLRVWNLSLLVATFSLTILATFLTRSGVIESVHSFSESQLGPFLIAFFVAVVLAGVGLIGWRGDRLRSAGGIETPFSREGAFLLNNVAFAAFAAVVLLGTIFPLLLQATEGQQVAVGAPYFDTLSAPIALTLLFLMAVAPALPWRRARGEVVRPRLLWPAWAGTLTVVACVAAGIRGLSDLLAFGLGAFAAASALRSLWRSLLSTRRAGTGWLGGVVGRANGGMVVHLGVVCIAVAMASATSHGHRGQVTLRPGQSTTFAGHRLTYEGTKTVVTPAKTSQEAVVAVDGRRLAPAVTRFGTDTTAVGSPAVDSGFADDVYLTLVSPPPSPGGPAVVGVIVQPLVSWLWYGGGIIGLGTVLAALPRRRRRPGKGARPEPAVATAPRPAAVPAASAGALAPSRAVAGPRRLPSGRRSPMAGSAEAT
ncbi:MAG: heme lyase CcmF/NrfE family subunit [Acidimicrobiales bacterium]